jgi:hypothetical protein
MLNWLLDSLLLALLLTLFYLDFTGIDLHQWLGLALGGFSLVHFLLHRKWVLAVVNNTHRPAAKKVNLFFGLDLAIFLGLSLTLFTGLVISTWFNLVLQNLDAWVNVHISFSIVTLLLAVLKIGLHSQWILKTFQRTVRPGAYKTSSPVLRSTSTVAAQGRKGVSRRQFLVMMGTVSLASALAIYNSLNHNRVGQAEASTGQEGTNPETPEPIVSSTVVSTEPQVTVTSTATGTMSPSATPTSIVADLSDPSSGSGVSGSCMVRCNHGCSYPGRCRRYVDTNSNQKCDLGECL